MEETYIGKVFIAEEDIEETGRVKVGGNYWTTENVGKKKKNIKRSKNFR